MGNSQQLELRVANLDCDHDAAALERGLRDVRGLLDLQVYPRAAKLKLTACLTPDGVWRF